MSVYAFRKHGSGYLAIVYGVHVGQVIGVRHRLYGETYQKRWRPLGERSELATEPTRKRAARALWDDYQAMMRERSS